MAVLLMMAHSKSNNSNASKTAADESKPTVFHDFLGRGCASDSSPVVAKTASGFGGDVRPQSEASPSASASVGASSGGGRGPISTTSDLGSERQVGNHFEGVPFYGPRSDFSGPEICNRFVGSKRRYPDSAFMGSSRDGFLQMQPDLLENSHLMKIVRNAGGERPRRPSDEETFFGTHLMRPASTSLILQPPSGGRTDANVSKWERAISMNVGPTVQYPPRSGQVAPYGYQATSNRFKDANAGPSVISQAAADEGSRTGIKGSGILSSINASAGVPDRNPSGVQPSSGRQKSATHISEPESSTPSSRQGLTSASRQMTIFYGGQAHVFDDVHPNKADLIMALAGSNGGCWSTTYAPKSAMRPSSGEIYVPSAENDAGMASSIALQRELRAKSSVTGNSNHEFNCSDRITLSPVSEGGLVMKDARAPVPAAEPNTGAKREI